MTLRERDPIWTMCVEGPVFEAGKDAMTISEGHIAITPFDVVPAKMFAGCADILGNFLVKRHGKSPRGYGTTGGGICPESGIK